MHLGLLISDYTWPQEQALLGDTFGLIVERAERAGLYSLWMGDHFFQTPFSGPPEHEMLEGWTALAYAAGRTNRLKLGTLVTGVTYRHPGVLVKMATSLDVLSHGRTYSGIGAAGYEEEHRGLGIPFPSTAERFERLEEALQIAHQMWSGREQPFAGKHFQLARPLNSPPAVQRPHPPILVGGVGERKTLRLVAQYADACNFIGYLVNDAAARQRKLDILREHCQALGRPYEEIERTLFYWLHITRDGRDGSVSPAARQLGQPRQQERRHRRALDALLVRLAQRLRDGRLDRLLWQRVRRGDGTGHQQPAAQAARPLRASDGRHLGRAIGAVRHAQPARAGIEGGQLVGAEADHWHAVRLQVFQRARQVEYRLGPGADRQHRRARQLGQISRDVQAALAAAMHPADAAGGEDANAGERGAGQRAGDGGGCGGAPRQRRCEVAPAGLPNLLFSGQPLDLGWAQAHDRLSIQHGDGGRHGALGRDSIFHRAGNLDVGGPWQPMGDHSGLERDHGPACCQRRAHGLRDA